MGYETRFSLKWVPLNPSATTYASCNHTKPKTCKFCPECGVAVSNRKLDEAVEQEIKKAKSTGLELYGIEANGCSAGECKWYDHEKETAEFSTRFPSVLFIMEGQGEESGDIWKRYYVNGKVQIAPARIEFDNFDSTKLADPK